MNEAIAMETCKSDRTIWRRAYVSGASYAKRPNNVRRLLRPSTCMARRSAQNPKPDSAAKNASHYAM